VGKDEHQCVNAGVVKVVSYAYECFVVYCTKKKFLDNVNCNFSVSVFYIIFLTCCKHEFGPLNVLQAFCRYSSVHIQNVIDIW